MNSTEILKYQEELNLCLLSDMNQSNIQQLEIRQKITQINLHIDALIGDLNSRDVKILTGICYQYYRLLYK